MSHNMKLNLHFLFLLLILRATNSAAEGFPNHSAFLKEHKIAKHGKIYPHPAEKTRRFDNFLQNLAYVRERKSSFGHEVGLNVFADLRNEEFRELYLSKTKKKIKKGRANGGSRKEEGCEAPHALDWRRKGVVTAAKDQGRCGEFFLRSI